MIRGNMETRPETEQPDTPCEKALEGVLSQNAGIVAASFTGDHDTVELAFDPSKTTESGVREVAAAFAPAARQAFEKCTMRLAGRACEACALRLERKAEAIPGVRRARATFLGGVMSVSFDTAVLSEEKVMGEVRRTGAPVEPLRETEEPPGKLESVFTGLALLFLVAGAVSARLALPGPAAAICYTLAYVTGGWFGVLASWESIKQRTIDVDLLMVLAALGAAFIGSPFEGATLLFLFSLSNVLQGHAIDRTRRAIHSLMKLRPENATVRRGSGTGVVPIEQLAVGDVVIVRPGERVPLDGTIIEGSTAIDESSVTGESIPAHKTCGDPAFAGTINGSGAVEIRVGRLAKDSTISRLIRLVEEAQSEKAKTQRWLDRAEQGYAMAVLALTAGLATLPALFGGESFAASFYRAMTVMVVASPCALIISTPATILSAIGGAARRGVLFKGGAHLERTASVKTVVFDKTGTLTEGHPEVTDVEGEDEREILRLAAAIEARSEHPLAKAIVNAAAARGIPPAECGRFQSVAGQGASGTVGGHRIAVGNLRYFEGCDLPSPTAASVARFQQGGKTAMVVARLDGDSAEPLGVIAVADRLRRDPFAPGGRDRPHRDADGRQPARRRRHRRRGRDRRVPRGAAPGGEDDARERDEGKRRGRDGRGRDQRRPGARFGRRGDRDGRGGHRCGDGERRCGPDEQQPAQRRFRHRPEPEGAAGCVPESRFRARGDRSPRDLRPRVPAPPDPRRDRPRGEHGPGLPERPPPPGLPRRGVSPRLPPRGSGHGRRSLFPLFTAGPGG
jgi:Cd2+/Zn2+-exporting ATPase